MWSNRLASRTPMPGVYLCGTCTHPGGSVIGINGRNAAMAVLADQRTPSSPRAADRSTHPVPHVSSRRAFDDKPATPNASDQSEQAQPSAPPAPLLEWQNRG
jgi:hypothetical protein